MGFDLVPLGTSSALPTRERHLSAVALVREGQVYLFDCGEGTQFRLMQAGIKRSQIEAVFITHFHGDHFFGLMGLYATIALLGRERPLTLCGPVGLRRVLEALPGLTERPSDGFEVEYVEVGPEAAGAVVYERAGVRVEARPLEHGVFTLGYRFAEAPRPGALDAARARRLGVTEGRDFGRLKAGEDVVLPLGARVRAADVLGPERPGAAFAYVTDTRPCANGVLLARAADVLYHEATFADDMAARAVAVGHSTAREAAGVARAAGARRLLLTHFSARYQTTERLEAEARAVFPEAACARELVPIRVDPSDSPQTADACG